MIGKLGSRLFVLWVAVCLLAIGSTYLPTVDTASIRGGDITVRTLAPRETTTISTTCPVIRLDCRVTLGR